MVKETEGQSGPMTPSESLSSMWLSQGQTQDSFHSKAAFYTPCFTCPDSRFFFHENKESFPFPT